MRCVIGKKLKLEWMVRGQVDVIDFSDFSDGGVMMGHRS